MLTVPVIGARSVDPYLDTFYSAFELARSGVTTVQHLPYPIPKCPQETRHRQVKYLNNVIEADRGKLKQLISGYKRTPCGNFANVSRVPP